MGYTMHEDDIKTYDELEPGEKEVFDTFRQMKLTADHATFRYHKLKLEDLLEDYDKLRKLREEIQEKYFSIYDELLSGGLIDGELDGSDWGFIRENENETWGAEYNLMAEIKAQLDLAISMIESGEAERLIIEEENNIGFNH